MKKRTIMTVLSLAFAAGVGHAENGIEAVLASIVENNPTLKTEQAEQKAGHLENHTGIFLASPEVEYAHLWGSPTSIRNRTDVSVVQKLDYATLSGSKRRLARAKDGLAESRYLVARQNVLLQAREVCIDVVYYNILCSRLADQVEYARTIAESYKRKLDEGSANILEYNKAHMGLTEAETRLSRADIERKSLLERLKQLNGGLAVELADTAYATAALPADFVTWFETVKEDSPRLKYLSNQIEVSRRQLNLQKAESLPQLSAGYVSEKTFGEHYQGVSIGLSVPLWENKNRKRQAKARIQADEQRLSEARGLLEGQLQAAYSRAADLQRLATEGRSALASLRHVGLLRKAFENGEITLSDYLLETKLYYESLEEVLSVECDCEKTKAQLYSLTM